MKMKAKKYFTKRGILCRLGNEPQNASRRKVMCRLHPKIGSEKVQLMVIIFSPKLMYDYCDEEKSSPSLPGMETITDKFISPKILSKNIDSIISNCLNVLLCFPSIFTHFTVEELKRCQQNC